MTKRLFDILVSGCALILVTPVLLILAILVKIDSRGPVLYRQERVGKNFRPFGILKFRTMVMRADAGEAMITVATDSRITKLGRFLRNYKLDELPQLINVLKGDMSLVGPRPEVSKYVELFGADYEKLLKVRPGITDPASIAYAKEAEILSQANNLEDDYVNHVLPDKIEISLQYLACRSFFSDLGVISRTLFNTSIVGAPLRKEQSNTDQHIMHPSA